MKDTLTGVGASLEAPTMVTAAGSSPVMAIIEHLDAARCRMRSVNPFEIGVRVAFSAVIHGAAPIPLQGTIASRSQAGPRFIYTVEIDGDSSVIAAIERAVEIARTRSVHPAPDVATNNGLTRASVRVPVDFPLRFTTTDGNAHDARATNISAGGILMNASEQLSVGASLELHFLLGDVPVSVHGRIVAHQDATPNYNIAFYDVRELVKETLARFINRASA